MIYHLALPEDWDAAQQSGTYEMSTRGAPLASVGFIHASYQHQVEGVANEFYADVDELVLLTIDPDAVGSSVVDESPTDDPGRRALSSHLRTAPGRCRHRRSALEAAVGSDVAPTRAGIPT